MLFCVFQKFEFVPCVWFLCGFAIVCLVFCISFCLVVFDVLLLVLFSGS